MKWQIGSALVFRITDLEALCPAAIATWSCRAESRERGQVTKFVSWMVNKEYGLDDESLNKLRSNSDNFMPITTPLTVSVKS